MAENTDRKQPARGPGRRFGRGTSGNPSGRPAGARNRATVVLEQMLEDDAKDVVQKAIELARAGDGVALRLIMDRVRPVRRGRPVRFALPAVATADDVTAALGGLLGAVSPGELTPDEAQTVSSILEVKRKAVELTVIEDRLTRIEAALRTGESR